MVDRDERRADGDGADGDVSELDRVEVRALLPADLDWVVRIDSEHGGLSRRGYLEIKLGEAQRDTSVRISLAALVDGSAAGFLMGRVYYGEFGRPVPAAILDTIGVGKAFAGRRVGEALLRQLSRNLAALRIEKIETQVDWDQLALIGFFRRMGFQPAARLCLELPVVPPR
jgi:ribosomal protein S18 acetylase RimI-like enzyme